MEPISTGELTRLTDSSNGLLLPRYLVTSLNVGDLTNAQTAKQGTRYEIFSSFKSRSAFPGLICVAKKASWGVSITYNAYVEEIEQHLDELNKIESPWHWLTVNIKKAEILCDPVDFAWDSVSLKMEGAENLAIDVLQRIGNDFLFRTNAIAQRQMMF